LQRNYVTDEGPFQIVKEGADSQQFCKLEEFIQRFYLLNEDSKLISDDDVLHIACKVEILDSPEQLHVGDNSIIAYPLKRESNLPDDIQKLFNDETFSDVTLAVDQATFKVHRAILAARSPVFKRMFSNEMKEKNEGIVDISD